MPGPGLSSRSRASYGFWVTYSTTPPSAGTPAGAVQRCPTLKPFTPNAAVSASQASASVPAAGAIDLHDRGALAAEVREIDPQGARRNLANPDSRALQLVVPIVGAGEKAMDNADDADASSARFDAPLGRDGRRARPQPSPCATNIRGGSQAVTAERGSMPGPKFNFIATGFPSLLLELSRHEPGRNTRPGGDGLPDFLRRAGDLEFDLDGTASGGFFLHAHDRLLGLGFLRQRVRHDHQAMRAAAGGGFIVIFRNECRDGFGEFVG